MRARAHIDLHSHQRQQTRQPRAHDLTSAPFICTAHHQQVRWAEWPRGAEVPRSAEEVRAIFDFLAPKLRFGPTAMEAMASDPNSTIIDVTGIMENPFTSGGAGAPR
jgi:hypothetical protein